MEPELMARKSGVVQWVQRLLRPPCEFLELCTLTPSCVAEFRNIHPSMTSFATACFIPRQVSLMATHELWVLQTPRAPQESGKVLKLVPRIPRRPSAGGHR